MGLILQQLYRKDAIDLATLQRAQADVERYLRGPAVPLPQPGAYPVVPVSAGERELKEELGLGKRVLLCSSLRPLPAPRVRRVKPKATTGIRYKAIAEAQYEQKQRQKARLKAQRSANVAGLEPREIVESKRAFQLAGQGLQRGGDFFSDVWSGIKKGAEIVATPLKLASRIPGIGPAVFAPIATGVELIRGAGRPYRRRRRRGGSFYERAFLEPGVMPVYGQSPSYGWAGHAAHSPGVIEN